MVFSSINFIFIFLPLLFLFYFFIPEKFRPVRNFILLAASFAFYAYGEPRYLVIMLISILLNYIFGLLLSIKRFKRKKIILAAAVFLNLSLLAYFKYTNFFLSNLYALMGKEFTLLNIVMPIGISFFTFQGLSYILDIFMGHAKAQKNPLHVALYISLFPQLIAGPIVRYQTIANEIVERHENSTEAAEGVRRFLLGLGKKMLIANAMGAVADTVFAVDTAEMSASLAWVGAIAYTFQIYFDFSGYSDMAIGLGKVFGFHFLENFNYPYISKSITEFWRRWHISLSTWFRDYVYIPLGGNRVSSGRHYFNIFAVWFLTGFWHGAAWNFIAWGLYFAVLLLLEKKFLSKRLVQCPKLIQHAYACFFIVLGWIIFRSTGLLYALEYIQVLFGLRGTGFLDRQTVYLLIEYRVEFIIAIAASLPVKVWAERFFAKRRDSVLCNAVFYHGQNIFSLAIFALSVIYLINSTFNPFIYFRF